MIARRWVVGLLLVAGPAWAQSPGRAPFVEKAAKRFPQPVRVGDLLGRQVIEPRESQDLLGRVAGIRRDGDGGLDLVMSYGGLLGFGARLIAVPIEAVALLGELVVVMDLSPKQLDLFPTAPSQNSLLGADETIRVGLVKPFH
jgi:hypothetical protein